VAGEHVGEKTQAQRDRANDDAREELERNDEQQDQTCDARWHTLVFEVAKYTVHFHTRADVNNPSDDRKRNSEAEVRERRELQEGNEADVVVYQDHREQREQERHERQELFRTDAVACDRVANESVDEFASEL